MPGSGAVTSVLVESYWPGVNEDQVAALAARVQSAASELAEDCARVDLVESIVIPADETVLWLFGGHEDDVRAVAARAGIVYHRILKSRRVEASTGGGKS